MLVLVVGIWVKEIEGKKKEKEFDSFDHNIRFTFLFLEIYIWMMKGSAFVIGSASLIWFFRPFVLSTYFVHMHNAYWLVCQKKKKTFFRTYPCGSVALTSSLHGENLDLNFPSPLVVRRKKKGVWVSLVCIML